MLWFGPKKFRLVIRDNEIEQGVREEGPTNFLVDYAYRVGGKEKAFAQLNELSEEGKLNPNFVINVLEIMDLARPSTTLFRGIDKAYYRDFLKYGNSKTAANASRKEAVALAMRGLDPASVIWAAPNPHKAWEYVSHRNPSILVLYDATKFEIVPGEHYLYALKAGGNCKDAVKAYIIIWYR